MASRTNDEGGVDVRKAPTDAVFAHHHPVEVGKCDWCGLPCDERTPVRKKVRPRHAACEREWFIIIRPDAARRAVLARDKGICVDCGEDWSELYRARPGGEGFIWSGHPRTTTEAGYWRYTKVIWVSLWHVDHRIPLWKVRHLPPLQRIKYFKLANMVTRCTPCHKFKTKKEAAERAKFNNQAADLAGPKPSKSSRKIASRKMQSANRFPPRGSRPMGRKKK